MVVFMFLKTLAALTLAWKAKRLSGCRHERRNVPCTKFANRNAKYLSDKHEAVTSHTCRRAAAVYSLFSHVRIARRDVIDALSATVVDDEVLNRVNELFDSCNKTVTNVWTSLVKLMVYKVSTMVQ